MAREDNSALRSEKDYVFGETLRETVGSVLDQLGKDWSDVRGMALRVHGASPSPYVDPETGVVQAAMIGEVLDLPASEISPCRTWGRDEDRNFGGVHFAATVWLDDAIIVFSDKYQCGDYVACEVIPTAPGPAYAFETSASSPHP